ncbi:MULTISPECIES: F0F1 ATP synthase subunit B family protein [Curvivirga]|uniref:F0F1 ATP synthase subunit B family protein n=1 Tax=Curvivirga TaxID=2856846 RepID=UPI0012BCF8B7|nr:F0F1 ATP synthase subunit B [Curvivirga aplysinae]MTI08258.1 F0F1 ATP synthase subunit B [Curvivirga aplysinae]
MDKLLNDPTFWTAVAFVIFVLLVVWKLRGAIAEAATARGKAIREELETAEKLKEEAQAALAELQKKQRDATQQAEAIVANAKSEVESMKVNAQKTLDETLSRREQQAKDKIAQAEQAAINEVRNLAVDMAMTASREILTEQLSGKSGDALQDAAIEGLANKLH